MKKRALILAALLVLATMPACTNKEGESEAPVFLTVSIDLQPGFVDVGAPAPVQISTITIDSHLKNPSQSDPQGFANVQVNSYQVRFRRTDGGTVVPATKTFGVGVVVPSGGSSTLTNFPVMNASDLLLSPFDQLLPFNGGIDQETGQPTIHLGITVTFYGETVAGTRVKSDPATLDIFVLYSAA